VALEAFMARRIGFLAMADIVERVMEKLSALPAPQSLDDVYAADAEARAEAGRLCCGTE
jgi:1-deoxy-D-xylulose-5-phosphate reductoisomerase